MRISIVRWIVTSFIPVAFSFSALAASGALEDSINDELWTGEPLSIENTGKQGKAIETRQDPSQMRSSKCDPAAAGLKPTDAKAAQRSAATPATDCAPVPAPTDPSIGAGRERAEVKTEKINFQEEFGPSERPHKHEE